MTCYLSIVFSGGKVHVDLENTKNYTGNHIAKLNPSVLPGGIGKPSNCVGRHKVAIIIPYRDREKHLILLLAYLHPFLTRQQLDYTIYVVEQVWKWLWWVYCVTQISGRKIFLNIYRKVIKVLLILEVLFDKVVLLRTSSKIWSL